MSSNQTSDQCDKRCPHGQPVGSYCAPCGSEGAAAYMAHVRKRYRLGQPKDQQRIAKEHRKFLHLAYCGLVLRGYNKERDIPDPILRKVWRYGKRIKQADLT